MEKSQVTIALPYRMMRMEFGGIPMPLETTDEIIRQVENEDELMHIVQTRADELKIHELMLRRSIRTNFRKDYLSTGPMPEKMREPFMFANYLNNMHPEGEPQILIENPLRIEEIERFLYEHQNDPELEENKRRFVENFLQAMKNLPSIEELIREAQEDMKVKQKWYSMLEDDDPRNVGFVDRWMFEREEYLKENKRMYYLELLNDHTLVDHLFKTAVEAIEFKEATLKMLEKDEEATEELKMKDPLKWAGIKKRQISIADELTMSEIICR